MTDKINNGLTALTLAMDEYLYQALAANESKSPTHRPPAIVLSLLRQRAPLLPPQAPTPLS